MIKSFLTCCILLILSHTCLGQAKAIGDDWAALERVESVSRELNGQIKDIDEPAFRVFLRLRGAIFLWETGYAEMSKKAEAMAVDALADLKEHEREIPPLYLSLFRSNLFSQLQHYSPDTAARLLREFRQQSGEHGGGNVDSSVLNAKDITSATEVLRQNLSTGRDPGTDIIYFLSRLQKEKPTELPSFLAAMVAVEERSPGSISVKTLSWTSTYFLNYGVPLELQKRFLSVCLQSVSKILMSVDPALYQDAYGLLIDILPATRRLSPTLFSLASAQQANLSALIPGQQRANIAMWEEISKSADPLNELTSRAAETKNTQLRDSLLIQAAQLALSKGILKTAVELAASTSNDDSQELWRNQFLIEVVDRALTEKDAGLAEYAVSKIQSGLSRATALQKIATFFFLLNDLPRAQELLGRACKLINESEDGLGKVTTALRLVPAFLKIDKPQTLLLVQAAIKAINNMPEQRANGKQDSAARAHNVENMLQVSESVISAFQSIASKDETEAFMLTRSLKRPGVKAAAFLGTSAGILLAEPRAKSAVQHK
jgi:hypothetical protein